VQVKTLLPSVFGSANFCHLSLSRRALQEAYSASADISAALKGEEEKSGGKGMGEAWVEQ